MLLPLPARRDVAVRAWAAVSEGRTWSVSAPAVSLTVPGPVGSETMRQWVGVTTWPCARAAAGSGAVAAGVAAGPGMLSAAALPMALARPESIDRDTSTDDGGP